jgi:L-lactate dehydrogenase complex protein LldE
VSTFKPRIHLFITCVADRLGVQAAESTVNLLRLYGCDVQFSDLQSCCGQPAYNAGHHDAAKQVARYWLATYDKLLSDSNDFIVTPSGSCGAMLHHYKDLLAEEPEQLAVYQRVVPKVRELTQFLVDDLGVTESFVDLDGVTVAYHDSCHAMRNLGVYEQPRNLLKLAGASLVEWDSSCCGFGGLFSVKLPQISTAMLDRKLDSVTHALSADFLTSTDLGCLLQLDGGLQRRSSQLKTVHIAELLDPANRIHAK